MHSGPKLPLLVQAAMLAAWVGCATEKPFRFDRELILPKPVHSHPWVEVGESKIYDASTLEDYINGAARPYLEYGMNQLIHAVYVRKTSPEDEMLVDVYEMASPLAAYGIYSIQRPEKADDVRLGATGFWSDGLLCFVKDRIYVSIQPPGGGPREMASAMLIAGYIDTQTRLPASLPEMISALPEQDRVRHSEVYQAANMLGHRFLGAGWQATYRYRGVTHDLFAIPCVDAAQALDRYEKLADYVSKNGKIARRVKGIGRSAMIGTGESIGRLFITCSGRYLVGTVDCFNDERSVKLAREVIGNVTRMGL